MPRFIHCHSIAKFKFVSRVTKNIGKKMLLLTAMENSNIILMAGLSTELKNAKKNLHAQNLYKRLNYFRTVSPDLLCHSAHWQTGEKKRI